MIAQYFSALWTLILEMSPFLLLGFLMAGVIKVFLPDAFISKYMGNRNKWSPLNAALLGVPLPLCSCGVIPAGISFYKNGAGKGASVSFLISTPQTGLDSILVTYSLLGLPFAILRPIIAFVTGIVGGFITDRLEKEDKSSEPVKKVHVATMKHQNAFIRMMNYAFDEFLFDIAKMLIIGLLIAAAITIAIPDGFFEQFMDYKLLSLFLVLVASVPMYICATASVPIAAALMLKGLSPGAALVFLMAGPATNAATIAVVRQTLGNKTFWIYLLTIVSGALLFGYIVDTFLPQNWFAMDAVTHIHHHESLSLINVLSAWFLIVAIVRGAVKRLISTYKSKQMSDQKKSYVVEGMGCRNCSLKIEETLMSKNIGAVVVANHATNSVDISGDNIDDTQVEKIVNELGYRFKGLK